MDVSAGPARTAGRAFAGEIAQTMAELLACGSIEMSPDRAADARAIAAQLPAGTRVYVNHPPRHALAQSHAALAALREAGLEPVAHIAVRRLASRLELDTFLARAAETGLQKVLLLGGDEPQPRGPYSCGADILRAESLARYGIREVGLPGYPEGHPVIPRAVIDEALREKLALLAAQGLSASIVTQFSFAPARVVEHCADLARRFPETPVYVGLAGPTEARALLRFAQRCGVSASLRALRAQGMGAVRLFTHTDPREQLAAIARHCAGNASTNVVGAHLFTFGGVAKTAAWINGEIAALGGAGSG
jgi:methylenetetrahydrofolate reductase (NADPH)